MICLICGSTKGTELFRSTDRLYRTTTELFSVVRCDECGMARLDPRPADVSPYYPRDYWFQPGRTVASRLEECYRRILIQDHVRFVEKALRNTPARGPVLDVGCGGGLFLGVLRERGARVIGLDSSTEAGSAAWRHNRVPAVTADLGNAPFAKASFSLISLFHVVEHLPDPRRYLAAARELLQPGGLLVAQVPNLDCWQFRLFGPAWNGVDIPRHLNNFRAKDLIALLEQCGFRVTRRKLFSWRDNPAGLATTLAPSLDPTARNIRGLDRDGLARLLKDASYFALVAAAVPLTMLEAACGKGSTVMVEACPTPR